MLLGRALNHQSSNSTVSPSVRSWRAVRVGGRELLQLGRRIVHARVDLARAAVAPERLQHLRERLAGAATSCSRTTTAAISPGVGAVVVAEVVVARVLPAEHRTRLGHDLLDERVPHPRADRRPAVLADHLGDGPRADEVVDDPRARDSLEHRTGDEGSDLRTAHALRALVDEEHPVRVAVEGETDVGVPSRGPRASGPAGSRGRSGSAGWLGNVPSSSGNRWTSSTGEPLEHRRGRRGRPCRSRCRRRP